MAPNVPANLGIITIRYLLPNDHAAYIALERDPEVKRYVGGPVLRSKENLRSSLRTYTPTTNLMAIADTKTDAFVGRCGLLPTPNSNELEIYCLLARSHWRMGIGQIIVPFLAELALHQSKNPIGLVDPNNQGSLLLLKRLNWVFTGTISKPGKQQGHFRYVPPGA